MNLRQSSRNTDRLARLELNFTLSGATVYLQTRKPFDPLVEGIISKNIRGDRTAIELFWSGLNRWPKSLLRATDPLWACSKS